MKQLDRKFEEIYDVSDYEIMTDTGWEDVQKVCKTVPYEIYKMELNNDIFLKCADDHIVYNEGKEIFVKDLKRGMSINTDNGLSECSFVENTNVKESMYDIQVNGNKYYTNGILSHNTTVVGVYALWYALFNDNKVICIVSNKEKSAKMILRRIKKMYEALPIWIKPGVEGYDKTTVYFDNGSQLVISATSSDAFRGETANLLIMDEFAFVPKNQAEEFWASNYPTIAASMESKIIIISTPNGMFNLFHRLYHNAEKGRNTFFSMKVSWQAVPGRDKKWAEEQVKNIGKQKFAQEFACVTGDTIITIKDTSNNKVFDTSIEELYENFLP